MKTNLTIFLSFTGTIASAICAGNAAAVTLLPDAPDAPSVEMESVWASAFPPAGGLERTYLDHPLWADLEPDPVGHTHGLPSGFLHDFATKRIGEVKTQDLPKAAWAFSVVHEPVISEDWLIRLQYTGFPEAPSPKPLIPVPEPATSTLLVAGVAALAWARRRV